MEQWVEISLGITMWYLTSFGTLILNKYLLGTVRIPANTLAAVQMVSTAVYGALKTIRYQDLRAFLQQVTKSQQWSTSILDAGDVEAQMSKRFAKHEKWRRGVLQMGLVGAMRFATVVLGLVSLKNVAASFTETVKASAPFFTVVIAYLMLGETSTCMVVLSLVPVAGGLTLASCNELSFNIVGFSAAVATNIIECIQNVFSKRLLAKEYTASQLQFYTSLMALVLQAPLLLLTTEESLPSPPLSYSNATASFPGSALENVTHISDGLSIETEPSMMSHRILALLWIDGVLYHVQSVSAYVVMSFLSPVTVSVVNTLKRALIIWISVLVFGNHITGFAKLGTTICLSGVMWYNIARSRSGLQSTKRT